MSARIDGLLSRMMKQGFGVLGAGLFGLSAHAADPIAHDAEFYVTHKQHAEKWAADDPYQHANVYARVTVKTFKRVN